MVQLQENWDGFMVGSLYAIGFPAYACLRSRAHCFSYEWFAIRKQPLTAEDARFCTSFLVFDRFNLLCSIAAMFEIDR